MKRRVHFSWALPATVFVLAAGPKLSSPAAEGDGTMPSADIVISLNRMDPVSFSHVRHLGMDTGKRAGAMAAFSCGDCHPVPFERVSKGPVGMDVPHDSGGCAQCHNGRKRADGKPAAFAANTRCLTCHKPPEP